MAGGTLQRNCMMLFNKISRTRYELRNLKSFHLGLVLWPLLGFWSLDLTVDYPWTFNIMEKSSNNSNPSAHLSCFLYAHFACYKLSFHTHANRCCQQKPLKTLQRLGICEGSGLLFQGNEMNRKFNNHNSCLLFQWEQSTGSSIEERPKTVWIRNLMLKCLRYVLLHFVVLPVYERVHCNMKNRKHEEAIFSCCFYFAWIFNTFVGDQMSGVTSVRIPPGHFAEAFVVFCCNLLLTCKFRQTNKN